METLPGSIRFYQGVGDAREFEQVRIVLEEAANAILRSMRDGALKGHSTAWTRETADHHVHRAVLHLVKGETPDDMSNDERKRHLQHALCRIAMALALEHFQIKAVQVRLPDRPTDYAEAA